MHTKLRIEDALEHAQTHVFDGTTGNNVLVGTSGNDVICGQRPGGRRL